MISILRGGFLEILLNLLSCLIFRFLPDRPMILKQGWTPERDLPGLPSIL
jgi:hypothetical protein